MSVSKLSLTLQTKILDGIISSINEDIATAKNKNLQKSFGNFTIPLKVDASTATRALTDINETGIFGKEGLQGLADEFNKIARAVKPTVSSRVLNEKTGGISKQAGYKNLKKYQK